MRIDVLKLIDAHARYTNNRRGRKNLGFLTRSAVVMLCAAWERYNEDLLLESIDYISNSINDINLLNDELKKTISLKVRKDKIETKPIELAGEGWKTVWKNYATVETELLNTPKFTQLNELFRAYLGIPEYTRLWKPDSALQINEFVSDRGEIAHNGNRALYIRMTKLKAYQELVIGNVINIDSKMAELIDDLIGNTGLPWDQEYYKDLKRYN